MGWLCPCWGGLSGWGAAVLPVGSSWAHRARLGVQTKRLLALAGWWGDKETLWGDVTVLLCPHSILTLSDYVTELGHPYVWVQKLGGLHFPKDQPQARLTPSPLP